VTAEETLMAALKGFFGSEPRRVAPEVRLLEAELLVAAELKKRGFQVDSIKNVGTNRTPSITLNTGLKIDVRARNLDTPTEIDDFSIKKNGARTADVVVCHDPLENCFYIFLRREVRQFWLDGEFYYSGECLYFIPWKSEEECKAYIEKTKKGRTRSWGRVFANKDRISDNAGEILKTGLGAFKDKWDKIRGAVPEKPDEKEKKAEEEEI
jgi:hypothetical protein